MELELPGDLHLRLHGELVEVGKALLHADHQRDAADHVVGAEVCAGVRIAEVHDRLRQHVSVGDLLEATDINQAARLRGLDGEHWPEDRGEIGVTRGRAVGGGVVKVRRDL